MKKLLAIFLASMLLVCGCSKNNISENNAGGVSADSKSEEQKITADSFCNGHIHAGDSLRKKCKQGSRAGKKKNKSARQHAFYR